MPPPENSPEALQLLRDGYSDQAAADAAYEPTN